MMTMMRLSIITLTAFLLSLLLVSSSLAQDTLLVSYQGRLTDDGGNPLTGSYDITLGIYAMPTGPSLLWSESHTGVPVSNGLFSVILGSSTALPHTIFSGGSRYLGISVGADPEASPRTLMTSVPGAAFAHKVVGDLTTEDGMLIMKDPAGDSTVVLSTGIADDVARMYFMDPGDDGKQMEFFSNRVTNEAGLYLMDPGDDGHIVSLTSSLENGGSFKMFNPQPEPPAAVLFEINADPGTSATMNIYDQIGQVMGFEPMPFNDGYLIKLMDPGDDGKLMEFSSNYMTDEAGIYLMDPGDDGHTVSLTSSATNGGSFKMFNPQPEPPAAMFELTADPATGAVLNIYDEIGQVMGFEPMPFNDGYSIKLMDPGDDGKLMELSGNHTTDAAGIYLMDPGDDGHIVSLTSSVAAGGNLSMFTVPLLGTRQEIVTMSGNGSTAELRMGMGAPFGGTESLASIRSDVLSSTIELVGPGGGPIATPPIVLVSNSVSARVGVGTDSPNYNLDVRGTIGNNTTLYHSDKRWKKNIEHLEGSLDRVMRLQGVQYQWRQDEYPEMNFPDGVQLGLIAQDVEKVIPEVVNESTDGYKSIDYAKLVSVLIESVKDQQDQIETLSKRIEELEGIKVSSR